MGLSGDNHCGFLVHCRPKFWQITEWLWCLHDFVFPWPFRVDFSGFCVFHTSDCPSSVPDGGGVLFHWVQCSETDAYQECLLSGLKAHPSVWLNVFLSNFCVKREQCCHFWTVTKYTIVWGKPPESLRCFDQCLLMLCVVTKMVTVSSVMWRPRPVDNRQSSNDYLE